MSEIIPFDFEKHIVRAVADDSGNPLFCAADVCSILGYANGRDAVRQHCRDSGVVKRDIRSGGQNRSVSFITEGNLYRLISKSQKPEAEQFEMWVFDDVLPQIRKTGSYNTVPALYLNDPLTLRRLLNARKNLMLPCSKS